MNVTPEQLALLKKHGFQWYKNRSTDRVDADDIKDVLPAANGFTVVYNRSGRDGRPIVLRYTTATVSSIDFPTDLDLQWIRIHWDHIEDERLPRYQVHRSLNCYVVWDTTTDTRHGDQSYGLDEKDKVEAAVALLNEAGMV